MFTGAGSAVDERPRPAPRCFHPPALVLQPRLRREVEPPATTTRRSALYANGKWFYPSQPSSDRVSFSPQDAEHRSRLVGAWRRFLLRPLSPVLANLSPLPASALAPSSLRATFFALPTILAWMLLPPTPNLAVEARTARCGRKRKN